MSIKNHLRAQAIANVEIYIYLVMIIKSNEMKIWKVDTAVGYRLYFYIRAYTWNTMFWFDFHNTASCRPYV